jgi:excisionase family DNA binding protein
MNNTDAIDRKIASRPATLRPKEAARYLGVSLRTLEDWRAKGKGPVFAKRCGRIHYDFPVLEAFKAAYGS